MDSLLNLLLDLEHQDNKHYYDSHLYQYHFHLSRPTAHLFYKEEHHGHDQVFVD